MVPWSPTTVPMLASIKETPLRRADNSRLQRLSSRRVCRRLRLLNHAEEVVVRIRQDNEVLAWPVSPRIARRPELEQSLYLSLAVVCIEVEVQSTSLAGSPSRDSVQRHVGSSSLRIAKNYPAVCRSFSRNVVQRLLPKRQHLVELVTTDDDRADLHFFLSTP